MPNMAMKRDLTPEQRRLVDEALRHVHPACDRATVDFDRIAIGTWDPVRRVQGVRQAGAADRGELRAHPSRQQDRGALGDVPLRPDRLRIDRCPALWRMRP
jgi:hypothetical protein